MVILFLCLHQEPPLEDFEAALFALQEVSENDLLVTST